MPPMGHRGGARSVGVPERLTRRAGTAARRGATVRATTSSSGRAVSPRVTDQRTRLWASAAKHSHAPLAANPPDGTCSRPDPLEVADGELNLGKAGWKASTAAASQVGAEAEHPPLGPEADLAGVGEMRRVRSDDDAEDDRATPAHRRAAPAPARGTHAGLGTGTAGPRMADTSRGAAACVRHAPLGKANQATARPPEAVIGQRVLPSMKERGRVKGLSLLFWTAGQTCGVVLLVARRAGSGGGVNGWSARSGARTNDRDAGAERRMIGRAGATAMRPQASRPTTPPPLGVTTRTKFPSSRGRRQTPAAEPSIRAACGRMVRSGSDLDGRNQ
jgi:hypothetical protein